jgi:tRNA-dihydrouridine synthase B
MLTHYGSHAGLRIARKHIGWYSKGLPQSSDFRAAVMRVDDAGKVRTMIDEFFKPLLDNPLSRIAGEGAERDARGG